MLSFSLSLSVLTGIFPGGKGRRYQNVSILGLLELRVMEMVVVTAAMNKHAKLHQIITFNKPTPNFLQAEYR